MVMARANTKGVALHGRFKGENCKRAPIDCQQQAGGLRQPQNSIEDEKKMFMMYKSSFAIVGAPTQHSPPKP